MMMARTVGGDPTRVPVVTMVGDVIHVPPKAGLVAQYFMHLKYEQKILSVIAYIPLVVSAILLTVVSAEWAFQPDWSFLG